MTFLATWFNLELVAFPPTTTRLCYDSRSGDDAALRLTVFGSIFSSNNNSASVLEWSTSFTEPRGTCEHGTIMWPREIVLHLTPSRTKSKSNALLRWHSDSKNFCWLLPVAVLLSTALVYVFRYHRGYLQMFATVASQLLAVYTVSSFSSSRAAPAGFPSSGNGLWYTQPATVWSRQYLPIGNGYLAAMTPGGVQQESLQLNIESLWSGGPFADPVS